MVYNEQLLRLIKDITPELYNDAQQNKDIRSKLEEQLDKTIITNTNILTLSHDEILIYALRRNKLQTVYDLYMEQLLTILDLEEHACVN